MRTLPVIRAALVAAMLSGAAGAALAQEAPGTEEAVAVAPQAPVAPWYQDFTRRDFTGLPLERSGPTVEFDAGEDWGFSLGFDGAQTSQRAESLDGISAGAFFKVSPRVRVGGALGYRAEGGEAAGLRPVEPGSSQIKLESAFRF